MRSFRELLGIIVFISFPKVPLIICSKIKTWSSNSTEGVAILNCKGCHEIQHILHDLGR